MQKANGGNPGPTVLMQQASERALLTGLLARLRTLDPDAIVGHNLTAFDMDVLLHRLQAHKVCRQPSQCTFIVIILLLPVWLPQCSTPAWCKSASSTSSAIQVVSDALRSTQRVELFLGRTFPFTHLSPDGWHVLMQQTVFQS